MSLRPPAPDVVSINRFALATTIGPDCWGKLSPQPVHISIELHLLPSSLSLAAATDQPYFAVPYFHVVAALSSLAAAAPPESFQSGRALTVRVARIASEHTSKDVARICVTVTAPQAMTRAAGGFEWGLEVVSGVEGGVRLTVSAHRLEIVAGVGADAEERAVWQRIILDVSVIERGAAPDEVNYVQLFEHVMQVCVLSCAHALRSD